MQTGIIWHSNQSHFIVDQTAYVPHYSSHFALFFSEHYTAWGPITKDKMSSLIGTSLHHPLLICTCTVHVAQSSSAWLWEADCWIRVWAPTVWRPGGQLRKALDWQLPKKKCWNQIFTSLLISCLHLGSFVCQWRLSELRPESQLNNLKTFLSKLFHLNWACPRETPWEPLGKMNGVQPKRLILTKSAGVSVNQSQENRTSCGQRPLTNPWSQSA